MERKVLVDILKDYLELKYIYEYGFSWDDKLANLLLGKGDQVTKRLASALRDMDNIEKIQWRDVQEGKGKRKTHRSIIKKNVYQLKKNLWYQQLYASYGKSDDIISEKGIYLEYINDYYEVITDLLKYRNTEIYDGYSVEIKKEFPDLVISKCGTKKFCLKKNMWKEETLSKEYIKETSTEVKRIYEMIAFFSEFAPIGGLGSNFLNRLGKSSVHPFIFVKNVYHNYAFEQEILYRCLYAIGEGKKIEISKKEITPQRVIYDDFDLWRRKSNLYVKGENSENLLLIGKKEIAEDEEFKIHQVYFLKNTKEKYGEITEYLEEKRKIYRKDEVKSEKMGNLVEFKSPYYNNNFLWECEKVEYKILKKDLPGFYEFIDSFGDFAYIDNQLKYENDTYTNNLSIQSWVKGKESLCNPYTSSNLFKYVEEQVKVKREELPPLDIEIEWIRFILLQYPNLCKVFINRATYEALLKMVDIYEIKYIKDENWDLKTKVQDIREVQVNKYHQIYEAVEQGSIICGEWRGERRLVFPYALQYYAYSADTYGSNKRSYPIEIMGYDLTAKRNIIVTYKNAKVNESIERHQYKFTNLEKIYHCLACVIRYAIETETRMGDRSEEISDKVLDLLETMWKPDNRSNSVYHRKIRKRCNSIIDYEQEYLKLKNKLQNDDEEIFVKNVFEYWREYYKQNESVKDVERRYHSFLLKCFSEVLQRYHGRAGALIRDSLNQISDEDIWEMICGESNLNEIAFYNESLKNEKIVFSIKGVKNVLDGEDEEVKKELKNKIDKIYRLFSEFTCTGECCEEDIKFTVVYEKFYFRKVHMYLMMMGDEIDDIGPLEVRTIIEQRKHNKKVLGEKLWKKSML